MQQTVENIFLFMQVLNTFQCIPCSCILTLARCKKIISRTDLYNLQIRRKISKDKLMLAKEV